MATINDLSVLIAEQLHRELDIPFQAMLAERIRYWRSRLIRNSLDKDSRERKFFTQSLYLRMEEVDATACGLPQCCDVMQTTIAVPSMIRANGIMFDYVGGQNGRYPIQVVPSFYVMYLTKDQWASQVIPLGTYENGKITIPFNKTIPILRVDAIFDNPDYVVELGNALCAGNSDIVGSCEFGPQDYSIVGDIAQLIVQSIIQIDFGQSVQPHTAQEVDLKEVNTTP